jgi:hypothetical protein
VLDSFSERDPQLVDLASGQHGSFSRRSDEDHLVALDKHSEASLSIDHVAAADSPYPTPGDRTVGIGRITPLQMLVVGSGQGRCRHCRADQFHSLALPSCLHAYNQLH